jgi:hypothetical protein
MEVFRRYEDYERALARLQEEERAIAARDRDREHAYSG